MKMVGLTERIISLERRSEGQSNRELAQKHNTDIDSVRTTITTLRTQITTLERQQGAAAGGAVGNPAEFEGNQYLGFHCLLGSGESHT